ncbi:MAG: hypothetical protein QOG37_1024 [Mycobacterium sp.]|nr:hypothetical protein [Mycobacterium sp.]
MSGNLQVQMPSRARELAGLQRVDYADAFAVDVATPRTPEEWIRLSAAASPMLFSAVRLAHRALGLPLAPPESPDHPIGWDILRSDTEEAVLGNDGVFGTPRIVVLTPPGQVVIATLIRLNGLRGRAIWAPVAPGHRAVVRYILKKAPTLLLPAEARKPGR